MRTVLLLIGSALCLLHSFGVNLPVVDIFELGVAIAFVSFVAFIPDRT